MADNFDNVQWRSVPTVSLSSNDWVLYHASLTDVLTIDVGGSASIHVNCNNTRAECGKTIIDLTSLDTTLSTEFEKNVVVKLVYNYTSGLSRNVFIFPAYDFEEIFSSNKLLFETFEGVISSIDVQILNNESSSITLNDFKLFLSRSVESISTEITLEIMQDIVEQIELEIPDIVIETLEDEEAQEIIQEQIDDTTEPIIEDVQTNTNDIVTLQDKVADIEEVIDSGAFELVIPAIDNISEMADLPNGAIRIIRSYADNNSVEQALSTNNGFY